MSGFSRLATVSASTKRSPAVTSGKRNAPTANLSGLLITPLVPLSSADSSAMQGRGQLVTGAPVDFLQTFIEGNPDILSGDVLTVGSRDYPIRAVDPWPFRGDTRLRIVVEKAGR